MKGRKVCSFSFRSPSILGFEKFAFSNFRQIEVKIKGRRNLKIIRNNFYILSHKIRTNQDKKAHFGERNYRWSRCTDHCIHDPFLSPRLTREESLVIFGRLFVTDNIFGF